MLCISILAVNRLKILHSETLFKIITCVDQQKFAKERRNLYFLWQSFVSEKVFNHRHTHKKNFLACFSFCVDQNFKLQQNENRKKFCFFFWEREREKERNVNLDPKRVRWQNESLLRKIQWKKREYELWHE